MGTYDTRGGGPISPIEEDYYIFNEEEEVLAILEAAGVPSEVNDKVVAVVRRILEQAYGRGE